MEERKDPFARYKFDEAIPEGWRGIGAAKGGLWIFLVLAFFVIQRVLGSRGFGDYALIWAGLMLFWVVVDGLITVLGTLRFFREGDRLKRYLRARFSQLIRIEILLLPLAAIGFALSHR